MKHSIKKFFYTLIGLSLFIGAVVGIVSLMIFYKHTEGLVDAYNNLTVNARGSNGKRLNFLTSYVKETGDLSILTTMGLSSESAKEIIDSLGEQDAFTDEDGESGSGENVTVPNSNDLMALAKAVAGQFGSYSQSTYKDISVNGDTKYTRTDCSGFVSAMLYYTGKTSNKRFNNTSNGFLAYGNEVKNEQDIQPGDVLAVDGHAAFCVKVEGGYVYTADCGGNGSIRKTAEQGFYKKYEINGLCQNWRQDLGIATIRRP